MCKTTGNKGAASCTPGRKGQRQYYSVPGKTGRKTQPLDPEANRTENPTTSGRKIRPEVVGKSDHNHTKNHTHNHTQGETAKAKGKSGDKAEGIAETRETQAKALLAMYAEIKPPGLDTSRSQAKTNIVTLLKAKVEYAALQRAVRNYRQWAEAIRPDPNHRKNAGNFFGREAVYQQFMGEDWKMPSLSTATSQTENDYQARAEQRRKDAEYYQQLQVRAQ